MAHFWGGVEGSRSPTSRCGTKKSGLGAILKSWEGHIDVQLWNDDEGDRFRVEVRSPQGNVYKVIEYSFEELEQELKEALLNASCR